MGSLGPGHGTITGVPFESSEINVKQDGMAITKTTDFGTTFVPLPGSTTVEISAPYAGNGTPIDVNNLAFRIAKKPFLLVVFWDDGASMTMWAMLSSKGVTSNQTAGSDVSYSFVCANPIEA